MEGTAKCLMVDWRVLRIPKNVWNEEVIDWLKGRLDDIEDDSRVLRILQMMLTTSFVAFLTIFG